MNTDKVSEDQVHGRRGSEDQERDKSVYRYLLTLTDLELNGSPPKPNESSIAKQWGMEDNRIFIRRMLRSVLHQDYYAKEKKQTVPGLTLGKLVGILSALGDYWRSKQTTLPDNQFPKILSRSDKLKALRLFFQLSVDERESLALTVHPGEALLRQLVEDATDPTKGLENEEITRIYKIFLRQHQLNARDAFDRNQKLDKREISEFIKRIIRQLITQHFDGIEGSRKSIKVDDLAEKVQREISRIEFQSGVKQAELFTLKTRDQLNLEYLTPGFVQRLTKSVVENEIITDELPIHFKYFEVTRVRPLPMLVQRENQTTSVPHYLGYGGDEEDAEDIEENQTIGLLNPALLGDHEDADSINGLERQFAYRVKVHFYIKLPENYQVKFPRITTTSLISDYRRLNFSEEIIGIGSPISHIISAINRVLLQDIPALKDYLSIADEVLNNDEVIGGTNHSPVWSHSVVRLYKNADIAAAIEKNQPCEELIEAQEVAYGEFCGFDLIEVAAKAALNARLKVIKQTGVNPQEYLKQLCHHIEELNALKRAKQYLNFHPFSLRAMEGELERTIFNQQYRIRKKDFNFEEIEPGKCWSAAAIDAHLEIADTNLKEGLYRVAKKYLDKVAPYFQEAYRDVLGNLLFAKYHLCQFRYCYLADLDDPEYLYPDRYRAVRDAEIELEKAEECLKNRLKKYKNLDELPQSNFHPQFYTLSRIYAHRAKLYIFFSAYARQLEDQWRTLLEPVRLLEKARIYAAQDGNPVLYAQWTAYQSWCYLMVAYRSSQHQVSAPEFTPEKCIEWARGLIRHALVCYSSTGKQCYQQIKDNGGKITKTTEPQQKYESFDSSGRTRLVTANKYYESYGNTFIQVVPLIQELKQGDKQSYDDSKHVINLDISLLKKVGKDDSQSTYLFGMHAGIILFAMGMLEICQDQVQSEALIEAIQTKALRMFTYCWAIASDGTERREKADFPDLNEDAIILDRVFAKKEKSEDYLLQSLYPHRLTQFADLGKIFVVVCNLLLLVASEDVQTYYQSKHRKTIDAAIQPKLDTIAQLIAELRTNNDFPTPDIAGQKRYNGHLAEHYKNFDLYVEQFVERLKSKKLQSVDIITVRNQLITDVFNIICGETMK